MINSDQALNLETLPKTMTVVGGGYIGIEMACIFAGFGVDVHYVYRGEVPLRGFDRECAQFVVDQLAHRRNLTLHPLSTPNSVTAEGELKTLHFAEGHSVSSEVILCAAGRRPFTAGLGLETVGIQTKDQSGAIIVDEYSRTACPSIYAVGDVTDRVNLTPVALMEGGAVAATLFKDGGTPAKPDYHAIPSAVFSNPELVRHYTI